MVNWMLSLGLISIKYLSLALGNKVVVAIRVSIGDNRGNGGLGDNGGCDLNFLHHRDGGSVGVGQGSVVDVVVKAVVCVVVDTVVTGVVEVSVEEGRVSLSLKN